MSKVYEFPSDAEWPKAIEYASWRDLPDLDDDDLENDEEDLPTPQHVIDILGFDPDDEDYEDVKANSWTVDIPK